MPTIVVVAVIVVITVCKIKIGCARRIEASRSNVTEVRTEKRLSVESRSERASSSFVDRLKTNRCVEQVMSGRERLDDPHTGRGSSFHAPSFLF